VLLEVEIHIDSDWNAPLFTGRLVKSLIIDGNSELKPVFAKTSGDMPKPVHISPLYKVNGNRVECVYSYADYDQIRGVVRKIHSVRISGRYRFYIGFIDSVDGLEKKFSISLNNIGGKHMFQGHIFDVDLVTIRVIDVDRIAERVFDSAVRSGKMKVVFSSPTLLRDPFRSQKHKSLMPTAMNIFSTPLYIYMKLSGKSRKEYLRTLIAIHRTFSEAHSIYNTVHKKWIIYRDIDKPIPTITGYINLYINTELVKRYNIEQTLIQTITTITTLGTGTSRATGFGHITLNQQ